MSSQQLVVFEINEEFYGVEISLVHEVIKLTQITVIPGADDCIEGVIDLRGDVFPVIDLVKVFHQKSAAPAATRRILITEVEEYFFGIIVDLVHEVRTFESEEMLAPPPGVNTLQKKFTKGMFHYRDHRLMIFLNLSQVIAVSNLLQETL